MYIGEYIHTSNLRIEFDPTNIIAVESGMY